MTAAAAGLRILDGIAGWVTDRQSPTVCTNYAIVLPRDSALADGAELLLESDRAVVVCAGAPRTMTPW